MVRIACGLVCLMLGAPCGLFAADCASLKNLQLEDTAISMAETVSSGTLDLGEAGTFQKLPVFCRVAGELHPTSDSRIRFEVWLPELGSGSGSGQNSEQGSEGGWNGRLLGVGNGGFAGSIYYRQMAGYLKRGFAVAGSDAGHEAEAGDASWAWQHPEKVKDFGWRAVHLTAERAKQMVEAYYGKAADRSYFDGCSDGGREALMEAQRFPEDYDGILAGAPANAWSTMVASGGVAMQALMADPRSYIPDGKLKLIERAALTACDALDGVKDGVIGDPGKCRFDPEVLLCKGGEGEDC